MSFNEGEFSDASPSDGTSGQFYDVQSYTDGDYSQQFTDASPSQEFTDATSADYYVPKDTQGDEYDDYKPANDRDGVTSNDLGTNSYTSGISDASPSQEYSAPSYTPSQPAESYPPASIPKSIPPEHHGHVHTHPLDCPICAFFKQLDLEIAELRTRIIALENHFSERTRQLLGL